MRSSLRKQTSLVMLLVAIIVSCTPAGSPAGGKPFEKTPFHVTVLARPFLSYAPFYIALEQGFFKDQGIEVEFISVATDVEAVTATLQNNIDVSGVFLTANLINGLANSTTARLVADKGYLDPDGCSANGLIASKALLEEGMTGPESLAGKRVALAPTTVEGFLVSEFLGQVGLSLNDIAIVEIPTPSEIGALADGSIDVIAGSEPWMTRISEADYGGTWIEWEDLFPNFQFAMVMYSRKLLENPDAGNRFMTAYLKAVRELEQGLTESNVSIIADFSGLDRELIEKACWSSFNLDGEVNLESIAEYQEWAVSQGQVTNPVEVEEIWDPSFIEAARQALDGA